MNEQIGKVLLDYESYSGNDLYSEGEIEDSLLEIVKNNKQDEFNKIIVEQNKWSILYHLSYLRGNIIEWLPITKNESVLEIGSGCGAITGILASKSAKVTCIELSKKRSLINAYRNKDKNNLEIKIGNFKDIEKKLKEKYDYITLIGVLEYAESYIGSNNPYELFLSIVRRHLKKDGKVIIAIENKLGLKYWAGCKEDHVGKYYEGIEGYTTTHGVRTFSKRELEEIAYQSGYSKCEFFYPYPDYKFATSIYSDQFLPNSSDLNNNLRNLDSERIITFDETKVYDTLIKEGLYQQFSNSFLILLEEGEITE